MREETETAEDGQSNIPSIHPYLQQISSGVSIPPVARPALKRAATISDREITRGNENTRKRNHRHPSQAADGIKARQRCPGVEYLEQPPELANLTKRTEQNGSI